MDRWLQITQGTPRSKKQLSRLLLSSLSCISPGGQGSRCNSVIQIPKSPPETPPIPQEPCNKVLDTCCNPGMSMYLCAYVCLCTDVWAYVQ